MDNVRPAPPVELIDTARAGGRLYSPRVGGYTCDRLKMNRRGLALS